MSAIFGFTFHIGRMTEVLTPDIYGAHCFRLRLELNDDEWWRQQYFSYARVRIIADKSQRVTQIITLPMVSLETPVTTTTATTATTSIYLVTIATTATTTATFYLVTMATRTTTTATTTTHTTADKPQPPPEFSDDLFFLSHL